VPSLLWLSYRRYLRKNWWLPLLSICAIATGVSVILGIDVASISARKSFALSTQALTGQATHSLVGSGQTVPDDFYRQLRVDWGLRRSAPVVEGYVSFAEGDSSNPSPTTLTLLGVDLLTDSAVRDWTAGRLADDPAERGYGRMRVLGSTDQVMASSATAQRLGWNVGQSRQAQAGGKKVSLYLAGVFEPDSPAAATALDNLLLADIATAQSILAQRGLDRVDLVLEPEQEQQLSARLPTGLVLQTAGTSQQTASELSAAFHTSLQALSYLCLLVSTFLIFNVVSFTVAHRRQSLGRLRVLGVTARELGRLLMGEALLLAVMGSALGTGMGLLLGRGLVPLVARTVNDLYYVQSITRFAIDPALLAKAFFSGLLATLVAAAFPALLAARAEPLDLMHRVADPGHGGRWGLISAGVGLLFLGLAGLLLLHPSLTAGLLCLLAIVIGYGLLVPGGLVLSVMAGRRLSSRLSYRMALQGLSAYFARSSTAAVALTVAVAATVSIAMMVSSFRGTLTTWLEATLTADIYLTLRDKAALTAGTTLDPADVERALQLPGLRAWTGQRVVTVPSDTGETLLVGVKGGGEYFQSMRFLALAQDGLERFERGEGLLLTEPYSRRSQKGVGDSLTLSTPLGQRSLPVLGVYYSYAPDRNMAMLGHRGFEPMFGADRYSGLAIYLQSPDQASAMAAALRGVFGETVEVRPTGELRALALEIFERTFTVTDVLRVLALGVALIGVLLSLMALAIERETEVSVLRALGMGRGELLGLAMIQSGWLGAVTGLLACPLGVLLAQVMIGVINRRAFGWTIGFVPDYGGLATSLGLGLLASGLAGLYPAWKWSQSQAGDALRERE
jgi:putative ABC transport system permease protein